MTIEELRREAKALGYNIIKIPQPMEKFLPCKCGNNSRSRWWGTHDYNTVIFECRRCGARAHGKNEREARHNWNEIMNGEPDLCNGCDYLGESCVGEGCGEADRIEGR